MNPFLGGEESENRSSPEDDAFRGPAIDATSDEGLAYLSNELGIKIRQR